MFILVELKETVRSPPHLFHMLQTEAIRNEINRKLSNKVMIDVGLCITMHSIVQIDDSVILPGDGATYTDVICRYLIFRPELGTIIIGKIRSCSREGVHITLGFFDDILIPAHLLQYPGRFEEAEQAWVWEYPLEDGEKHDLFLDIGESIKFRVVRETFEENSPVAPVKHKNDANSLSLVQTEIKIPYRIIGAINEPGLGVLSWWNQENEAEEIAEAEEEEIEEQKIVKEQSECDTIFSASEEEKNSLVDDNNEFVQEATDVECDE